MYVCHSEGVTYGKTLIQPFQPAVSVSLSYGKMVPPTTPYGKTISLEHWGVGGTVQSRHYDCGFDPVLTMRHLGECA